MFTSIILKSRAKLFPQLPGDGKSSKKIPNTRRNPKLRFMTLSISVTKKVSGLQKKIPDFFNGVPAANTSPKGMGKSND